MTPLSVAGLSVFVFAALVAIAGPPSAQAQISGGSVDVDCTSFPCGRVESIRQSTVKTSWTPLGTAAGFDSDARAVTSFQIGPGLSNQGMVVLGAGGGAAYRKSPNQYEQPRWEVTVKLDNGAKRVVTVAYEPFVREGDRVRIAGNSIELID
jgi:outer membrane lipoprotein SlyB